MPLPVCTGQKHASSVPMKVNHTVLNFCPDICLCTFESLITLLAI